LAEHTVSTLKGVIGFTENVLAKSPIMRAPFEVETGAHSLRGARMASGSAKL
jgi:hypothetical protein